MKKTLAFLSAVLAVFVRAEVADLTSSLEYVGNPNAARWSEVTKRPVTDLKVYEGKLFVSGGAAVGTNPGTNSSNCRSAYHPRRLSVRLRLHDRHPVDGRIDE